MSSTNKTTHYELSQYIGTDKPTYLGDYNSDMLAIDTAIYNASDAASTAVSTANSAASTASDAATAASTATTTANTAANKADAAKTTAETASTNASAALTAAQGAQMAASANTITNLAPAYDPTLTYAVGDLVTFIDDQGSGKLYKCIVDIAVPEAFNINKWDDVTTSEVYKKDRILVATYTCAATDTWGVIVDSLSNNLSIDDTKNYYLEMVLTDGIRKDLAEYVGSTDIDFIQRVIGPTNMLFRRLVLSTTTTYAIAWTITSTGATEESVKNNAIGAVATFNLYAE